MRTKILLFGLVVLIFSCLVFAGCRGEKIMDPPPPPPEFNCREFWESFSLEEFCGLDVIQHAWAPEDDDLCVAQINGFNTNWTEADIFYVYLGFMSDLELAMQGFTLAKTSSSSEDGFSIVSGMGDEAFMVNFDDDDPDSIYDLQYSFRKGTVLVDILFGKLDCFTEEMVRQMAQKIADQL